MKSFSINAALFIVTLIGLAFGSFFYLLLLILGGYQLMVLLFLLKQKLLHNKGCSRWLKYYIYATVISTLVFGILVYYLNVRPDLFSSIASTESALSILMRLFLIPAGFHLILHRRAVGSGSIR